MSDCRITCVTKPDRFSRHEHITHVGNPSVGWKITREQAIANIESKLDTFYVQDEKTGKRSEVGVRREDGKVPYLRTYADGYYNDNLLSLDECN
jgi:hypothetical protein